MIDHVTKGQKFGVKAVDWNTIIDMANGHSKNKTQKYKIIPKNMVQVINNTTETFPMFAVVEYSDFHKSDLFPEEDFITFTIKKPFINIGATDIATVLDLDSFSGRICILQQPLPPNHVGLAIYTGLVKVKLKKQTILDETKPMGVIKINNDATKMEVTNRVTPDKLLWHNSDFSLGVVQLNFDLITPSSFVGLLKILPDTTPKTFKVVVTDVYTKRIYHLQGDDLALNTYRNLTKIPARPRSLGVVGYYTKTVTGVDYAQVQSFFSTNMEGVVNFNDAQTILNSMVTGKRSQKDIIGTERYGSSYSTWYGDYQV